MLKVGKGDISSSANCRYVGHWSGKNWMFIQFFSQTSGLPLDLEVLFYLLGL